MPRVFISYHHANDQQYKEALVALGTAYKIFDNWSVDTGDISDNLTDQQIREKIRDEYLKDSSVTIVLVGTETRNRKHVDWEIYSSMFDGTVNKKSGVLVITLPSINCTNYTAAHEGEKETVYPECTNWFSVTDRATYEERYPYLPGRIIDNLTTNTAKISVASWTKIAQNPGLLKFLVDATYNDRARCTYDLSTPMRRRDS